MDEVIRKVLALLGGERGVRLLFQGNAVRVGPAQFPKLWHLHNEVVTTFDWPTVPELYVSQTPFFNAGAYGIDQPFIVIHSAAIELLDDDELRVLLSHELGHVMSGHALYRTIAAILALISLGALPDARRPGGAARSGWPFSSGPASRSSPPTAPGCSARRTSWRRSVWT